MSKVPFKTRRRYWRSLKKILTILLAVQVVCVLFWILTWFRQGSTVQGTIEQKFIELSFVVPQNEVGPWNEVVKGFEAEHQNIQITLITNSDPDYTTDDRRVLYDTDLQDEIPDYNMVYMDIVWTAGFKEKLKDLMYFIKEDQRVLKEDDQLDLFDFLPSELPENRKESELYRLPMSSDIGVLYYRKDLLDQANLTLPSTFEELEQVVDTLKQTSEVEYGYLWQGDSYEGLVVNAYEVMRSFDTTWIDDSGTLVGLDASATIQAVQLLDDLIPKISPDFVTNHTEQSSLDRFKEGKTVFLRGWSYFWKEIKEQEWSEGVAIALPFSFTGEPGVGCRGGWGFGIPQNTDDEHAEAAWEAIKYFTSKEAQKTFVLESGFLPSRRSLFQDPDIIKKYPMMTQMQEFLEQSSVLRPSIPQYEVASEILQTALGKILSGEEPAEVALKQAQQETEALLQQATETQ